VALHYAEENPDEVAAALDDKTEPVTREPASSRPRPGENGALHGFQESSMQEYREWNARSEQRYSGKNSRPHIHDSHKVYYGIYLYLIGSDS
jgi:hypothetical protein